MTDEMVEMALENVRRNKSKYVAMGEAGRSDERSEE
jgi:hypothetical protein